MAFPLCLERFPAERGLAIVSWYVENESGAKLTRPELFKLLGDAHEGDILLVEQVDRLSRLSAAGRACVWIAGSVNSS